MMKRLALLATACLWPMIASAQTVSQSATIIPAPVTAQSAATGNGNGTAVTVGGYATVLFSVTASVAMSGGTTVNFECTTPAGAYTGMLAWKLGTAATFVSTTTAIGDYQIAVGPYQTCRARISAYSAGTITVTAYRGVLPSLQPFLNALITNNVTVVGTGTFVVQAAQSGAWNITNISGTVSLPTGASTAAKQPALGTAGTASLDVISVQGIANMTPLLVTATGSGNFTVVQATASNLNATVVGTGTFAAQATLQTQTDTIMVGGVNVKEINAVAPLMGSGNTGTGSLRVTPAADVNAPVNLVQVAGGTAINAGVTGSQAMGGCVATNVATPCNPVGLGAIASSAEPSAATNAREVALFADLVGKLINLPYANPENEVHGTTAAITDTTSTSVIASAGGSLKNYITDCVISNSHATVGTFVKILEGTNIIDEVYAAAAGGGAARVYLVPRRSAAATAINAQPVTTGANVIVSCGGYKGL